ncbi:MAG: hypothetical protein QOJ59_3369, partial [Thermomicrobiales bacterium]|nr:hypothetical protein [Thermomicrobiales bacterium]
ANGDSIPLRHHIVKRYDKVRIGAAETRDHSCGPGRASLRLSYGRVEARVIVGDVPGEAPEPAAVPDRYVVAGDNNVDGLRRLGRRPTASRSATGVSPASVIPRIGATVEATRTERALRRSREFVRVVHAPGGVSQ